MKQIDISTATFRVMHESPGHVTYGFWVNGAKCGDLVVGVEQRNSFENYMTRGGWRLTHLKD